MDSAPRCHLEVVTGSTVEIFYLHILDDEKVAWIVQIYGDDTDSLTSRLMVSASLPSQLAPHHRITTCYRPMLALTAIRLPMRCMIGDPMWFTVALAP